MSSDIDSIIENPDLEKVIDLDKHDLMQISNRLGLKAKDSMKNSAISIMILRHFVKVGKLSESLFLTVEEEARKFQVKKLDVEMKRIESEREKANQEFVLKKLEKNLEMKKLELFSLVLRCQAFNVSSQSRLVPRFDADHVDQLVDQSEKLATHQQQSSDYEGVKKSLAMPEDYWQKFQTCMKHEGQSFIDFASEMEKWFDMWCESIPVDEREEKLRQMMLLEQFRKSVLDEVRTYLDEQKVVNVRDAAKLTDKYLGTAGMTSPSCQ